MAEIYHMLTKAAWEAVRGGERYAPPSLASEGFIHCTVGERNLIGVANRFYRDEPGEWMVLVIDPARIDRPVRWELQPDGLAYPHVHGDLNVSCVVGACAFPRAEDGEFLRFGAGEEGSSRAGGLVAPRGGMEGSVSFNIDAHALVNVDASGDWESVD